MAGRCGAGPGRSCGWCADGTCTATLRCIVAKWPSLHASIWPRRDKQRTCRFARRSGLGHRASEHGCQHAGDPICWRLTRTLAWLLCSCSTPQATCGAARSSNQYSGAQAYCRGANPLCSILRPAVAHQWLPDLPAVLDPGPQQDLRCAQPLWRAQPAVRLCAAQGARVACTNGALRPEPSLVVTVIRLCCTLEALRRSV